MTELYAYSGYTDKSSIHFTIAASVAITLCLFGLLGNAIVFWYLSFRSERNKYTVYMINLAAADFIFLLSNSLVMMLSINTMIGENPDFKENSNLHLVIEIFYDCSQYSGMFFFTALSLERCLSVIFPIWYQSSRPKNQSTITCFFLWVVGLSESLIGNLLCQPEDFLNQTANCTGAELMEFVIGIGICLPLMVLSSVTLLTTLCLKFRKQVLQELYIFIIVAVFINVLSVTLFNLMWFLMYFQLLALNIQYVSLFYATVFGTALNSTINPYLYFFAERKWRKHVFTEKTEHFSEKNIA
ncbi:mas-related G-protein coupled receptor member X1-like [Spea bombifrons]|uniref:mas-related G-protein coupled receptor member X1-like n=1 Tax=Spea bombifrons TaxID=233779 RepID=UPI00234A47C7|nr:mas-related G-protein coupled receptor member X1-like [Spea bombifrons]